MKYAWLALACAAFSSWQGRASACSVRMPEKQSLDCSPARGTPPNAAHLSVANARLQFDRADVRRSRYAPPGHGDCGELGSVKLHFSLAGSSEWPADVAVLLTLRTGTFNYFQPPLTELKAASGWLLLPLAGAVSFLGPDDPHEPLGVLLEARAVDCSGATSAPIEVRLEHPGSTPDAGSAAAGGAAGAAPSEVVPARTAPEVPAGTAPRPAACALGAVGGSSAGGLGLAWALAGLALRRRAGDLRR